MVNNSSKLNILCFDTCIITFPSKEKGEFDQPNSLDLSLPDQPNSLDLSLPVTCNRYLMKLSVAKSIHFPLAVCCFLDDVLLFFTMICFD